MAECRTVLYSGRVQGVGFRYTVRQIAFKHDVSGTVRNLPDGDVELVCEGEPDELDRFMDRIASDMHGYIRETKIDTSPASGRLEGFAITY